MERKAQYHYQSPAGITEREGNEDLRRNGTENGLASQYPDPQTAQPTLEVDYEWLKTIGRDLLLALGYDPHAPGISDTPRRFASLWQEFIEYEPGRIDTVFESVSTDQMVAVTGMRVWSMCEHHLLPFYCDVSIAYIARDHVLGLSKFARIAHAFAHRLQLQERLAHQIADAIQHYTHTKDVAVVAVGEHLCMTMRGIKTPATMRSSVLRGAFRDDPSVRSEFFSVVGKS